MQAYFVLHTLNIIFDFENREIKQSDHGKTTDLYKRKRKYKDKRTATLQGCDTQRRLHHHGFCSEDTCNHLLQIDIGGRGADANGTQDTVGSCGNILLRHCKIEDKQGNDHGPQRRLPLATDHSARRQINRHFSQE